MKPWTKEMQCELNALDHSLFMTDELEPAIFNLIQILRDARALRTDKELGSIVAAFPDLKPLYKQVKKLAKANEKKWAKLDDARKAAKESECTKAV